MRHIKRHPTIGVYTVSINECKTVDALDAWKNEHKPTLQLMQKRDKQIYNHIIRLFDFYREFLENQP